MMRRKTLLCRSAKSLLIPHGSSLGGARPKASIIDPHGQLWIAKFPSRKTGDIGGWEAVVNILAIKAGLNVAEGKAERFTKPHHSYLTKRFDRIKDSRIHFASAMTLLGYTDGADAAAKVSYLHLAEFIVRHGAHPMPIWKNSGCDDFQYLYQYADDITKPWFPANLQGMDTIAGLRYQPYSQFLRVESEYFRNQQRARS